MEISKLQLLQGLLLYFKLHRVCFSPSIISGCDISPLFDDHPSYQNYHLFAPDHIGPDCHNRTKELGRAENKRLLRQSPDIGPKKK